MTLSLASSNSAWVTMRLLRRAAIKAASLTRFIRSAPEKPGVPRATVLRLTSGASGTLRTWTLRICSRPTTSGFGTTTWRSKRPGRSSDGASTAGRPDQQHAARDAPAEPLEFAGIAQELDDLLEILLGLVDAGDVLEGDAPMRLGQKLGPALAEAERFSAGALHLPGQEYPYADQ